MCLFFAAPPHQEKVAVSLLAPTRRTVKSFAAAGGGFGGGVGGLTDPNGFSLDAVHPRLRPFGWVAFAACLCWEEVNQKSFQEGNHGPPSQF